MLLRCSREVVEMLLEEQYSFHDGVSCYPNGAELQ